jgi:hypothetical protein
MAFMIHISDGSTFIDYRDKVSFAAPKPSIKEHLHCKIEGS